MGSEQSRESMGAGPNTMAGGSSGGGIMNNRGGGSGAESPHPPPMSSSPRPSISSDADLPYISYTVNRPIGGK